MDRIENSTAQNIAFFVALLATALALGAALAHALELPNKIGMTREHYFIVQRAYDGWNRIAYLLAVELAGMLAVIWLHRAEARVLWPAVAALGCLVAAQAIFWIWTFPANQATVNWTVQPENWATLRSQWEYSHLAGAAFQALAMTALIVAVMRRGRGTRLEPWSAGAPPHEGSAEPRSERRPQF
ncbi:MAG: DUF1772 domain-containing protein [Alphaproteobacteria bacterium]